MNLFRVLKTIWKANCQLYFSPSSEELLLFIKTHFSICSIWGNRLLMSLLRLLNMLFRW